MVFYDPLFHDLRRGANDRGGVETKLAIFGGGLVSGQPARRFRTHRLRLSVRAMLLLVLLIGGGLGWLIRGARIQREAVAEIKRKGDALVSLV